MLSFAATPLPQGTRILSSMKWDLTDWKPFVPSDTHPSIHPVLWLLITQCLMWILPLPALLDGGQHSPVFGDVSTLVLDLKALHSPASMVLCLSLPVSSKPFTEPIHLPQLFPQNISYAHKYLYFHKLTCVSAAQYIHVHIFLHKHTQVCNVHFHSHTLTLKIPWIPRHLPHTSTLHLHLCACVVLYTLFVHIPLHTYLYAHRCICTLMPWACV